MKMTGPTFCSRLSQCALIAIAIVVAWLGSSVAEAREYKLHTLHAFCSEYQCADGGQNVEAGLITDPAGNLYGTTERGGIHDGGAVFKLARQPGKTKWRYKVVYNFCALNGCTDGAFPYL